MIITTNKSHQLETTELIQQCTNGNQTAWNTLIDRYGRLVYSIPRQYGMCDADADDVFQNVFATLHQRLGTLRDPKCLSSWLITTTHRECWRLGHQRGRQSTLTDRWCDPCEPPHELAAQWEQQQLVREALQRLSKRERELITALFLESEKPEYDVVARRLGMKRGSIGPTRARCFKKLECILKDLGIDTALNGETDRQSRREYRRFYRQRDAEGPRRPSAVLIATNE